MDATMSTDADYNILKDANQNCELLLTSINIDEINKNDEIDLTNMLTIFDEEEEDNIVNLDEESDSQPQNTNNLVEKIKRNLHKALNHYWDAPPDHSLITMLLDPCCKFITKLDNWEYNKAISLL
ncbi:4013_t:CDS:2 [Gigaspora margarita]|uniref:4013_t:CDS:1 n=1 Tax=Gigaspora margarita TaxID=4874 RepID=A0ABM8W0Z1_GIGMA|nr:4013_t:CDS:2 [Gigaspora margarita]